MNVMAVADTGDFGQNLRASVSGVLQRFEDYNTGAFPKNGSRGRGIERPAGRFRTIVTAGRGPL